MSVYTQVHREDMIALLRDYPIGELVSLEGIAQGVTNSNYLLVTTVDRYILTIFETLNSDELPFFLLLTQHLDSHGVPCPAPIIRHDGKLISTLSNKPACIVSYLDGRDTTTPSATQCFNTGKMLAQAHISSQNFPLSMKNPRDFEWCLQESQRLIPLLDKEDAVLLQSELNFLEQHQNIDLPSGIIHADLFKDNVLLDADDVAGFIDFYYACHGLFVYDIAIAINDWARLDNGHIDESLKKAFLEGYYAIRPMTLPEQHYLYIAQRAACIRFWVSRLIDAYFPQSGEMTLVKDPNVFKSLLLQLAR